MKIKIIDLLNKMKIDDNYRPKQVKWATVTYYYDKTIGFYKNDKNNNYGLFSGYTIEGVLNKEVEIIEEDKQIKKLYIPETDDIKNKRICKCEHKINELIDEINKLKENKDV